MHPLPESEKPIQKGKLLNKATLITGGDSEIGKAISLAFANEGAHIVIVYLNEDADAKQTQQEVLAKGVDCLII